jgi:hypothetical protein
MRRSSSIFSRTSAPLTGDAVVAILMMLWVLSILYPSRPKEILGKKDCTLIPICINEYVKIEKIMR